MLDGPLITLTQSLVLHVNTFDCVVDAVVEQVLRCSNLYSRDKTDPAGELTVLP